MGIGEGELSGQTVDMLSIVCDGLTYHLGEIAILLAIIQDNL